MEACRCPERPKDTTQEAGIQDKEGMNGEILKYKVRWVVQGFE